jgi:hypothetical protein
MPNIIYNLKLDNTINKSIPIPVNIHTPIPTNKSIPFGQLVKEGMAFGTGSIIAKNVGDKVMNAENVSVATTNNANNTNINNNNNNKNKCDLLKEQFDRCVYKDTDNNCTYIKNLYEKSCKNNKN